MLFSFTNAVSMVMETGAAAPPVVPVEIVNQPKVGWSMKDVVTLALSVAAFGFSVFTWRGQTPRGKLTVFPSIEEDEYGRKCFILQLFNKGRMEMSVGCPGFTNRRWMKWMREENVNFEPINDIGAFPAVSDYDLDFRKIAPLEYIAGSCPISEVYRYVQEYKVSPEKVLISVEASGKCYYACLPEEVCQAVVDYDPEQDAYGGAF